jgi:hypothetical protein
VKTFQEFLEESALARLALRGIRSASRVARTADGGRRVTSAARATRNVRSRVVEPKGMPETGTTRYFDRKLGNSDLAAFKKANFRTSRSDARDYDRTRPRSYSYKSTPSGEPSFYTTIVSKYPNQAAYAQRQLPDKKSYGFNARTQQSGFKVTPSRERAFFASQLRKQLGGTRTPKQVADIEIGTKSDYYRKNDPTDLIGRGKEFVQTLKDVPQRLATSNVKPGDKVTAHPAAVMPGETNKVMGRKKRADLYKRIAGNRMTKMNPVTQALVGTMQ